MEQKKKKKRYVQKASDYKIELSYADNNLTLNDILNTEEFKDIIRELLIKY